MRRAALLLILLHAGCAGGLRSSPPIDADATWPFWPTAMRIHPLTRVTDGRDGQILEARVEFVDRDGITSRAVGLIQLELTGEPERERSAWTVDLGSLTANATHFDDITRTYLFRLELVDVDRDGPQRLRVTFFGAEGREFEATEKLR